MLRLRKQDGPALPESMSFDLVIYFFFFNPRQISKGFLHYKQPSLQLKASCVNGNQVNIGFVATKIIRELKSIYTPFPLWNY